MKNSELQKTLRRLLKDPTITFDGYDMNGYPLFITGKDKYLEYFVKGKDVYSTDGFVEKKVLNIN